ERGLPDRATYRGANPQAELSVSALKGLKEDGLTLPTTKPSPITSADVTAATHIFAIGCSLPAHAAASGKADSWDDVPEDQGYAAQRDAIKKHVEHLIDQLQQSGKPAAGAAAPEMPTPYKAVLETLGKTGDYKDNVLKVN